MTTNERQLGINSESIIWLGDMLERWGLSDPVNRAEFVVRELIDRGIARAEPIPPARPTSVATPEQRARAMAEVRAALGR